MRRTLGDGGSAAGWLLAVAAVLGVMALVAAGAAAWAFGYVGGPNGTPEPVQVEIPKDSSTETIARTLEDKGVVGSALRFRIRARMLDADGELKAGVYELSTNMPDELVVERLVSGPEIKYSTVTIPEGFTVDRIATRLENETGIDKAEFLKKAGNADEFASEHPYLKGAYRNSVEGFLFPKTYRIKEGSTATEVIEMMLRQFDKEVAGVDFSAAEKRGLDFYDTVTLASLVEREARVAKDRPLISSVIYNRLEQDKRLELCSTVDYALNKKERSIRLTLAETRTDSPYNTYRAKGLPPGPIANPGLDSLKAAAEPADTSYIYFVLTSEDGSHTFARDDAEFLAAKRKSKEVFGQ